jgi:glycosyltransferase involved in cell wall biosynthesis
MICDDERIDRRILQEAGTLIERGYRVTLLSRSGEALPAIERRGGLIICRIAPYSEEKEQLAKIPFSSLSITDTHPSAVDFEQATAAFDAILKETFPAKGLGYMPEHYAQYGKLRRHLAWALLWPPHRLFILSKVFPRMPRALRLLMYLLTLIMTPFPSAIRFHWHKAMARFRAQKRQEDGLSWGGPVVSGQKFSDLSRWEVVCFLHGAALKPDIVHVHDLPQLRAGAFIARLLGTPFVYDAHEFYPAISSLGKRQQAACSSIESQFISFADAIITVNPFIGDLMRKAYGISSPTIVQNAVSIPETFAPERKYTTLREHLGLEAKAKILLFQGWISVGRTNMEALIEALPQCDKTIHLAMLGFGDAVVSLLSKARQCCVAGRVHYVEAVSQDELLPWVASADAGVIPYLPIDDNHLYCSPNKLYEFMACRLPIIANDLPFVRSVVEGHGIGVVRDLSSSEGYAEAIREMFDPAHGDTNRFAAAYERLMDPFFLWENQENILLGVYSRLPEKTTREHKPRTAFAECSAPLRVLHGFHNIAGIPSVMAASERELGLHSLAACYDTGTFGYRPDIPLSAPGSVKEFTQRFTQYADSADVFVFHFGFSFGEDTLTDIPLLKRMGKKIIFYFHGCDILNREKTLAQYPVSACACCNPPRCNPNRDLTLAMAGLYADAIWVSTPNLMEFAPNAKLFPQPLDVRKHTFTPSPGQTKQPGPVKIVHSPSAPKLKGTAYVRQTIAQLREEGIPVELLLLQGIPHDQLMAELAKADLAIDQLLFGAYGTFAVELMADGVPVICHIRDELRELYPASPPIVSATPDSLADVIRDLVADTTQWNELSMQGRRYVEEYHSTAVAAKRAKEVYTRAFL